MIKTIALDTESFYSNDFGIKQLGTHRYATDPRCDVYLISICDGTETWAGHPRDFNFSSLEGQILLSHHAAHDQEIYLAERARGLWPEIKPAAWHCTANMSAYLCNRRSLADAADFLLGVKVSKGMRDWMKGRTWDDAVREGKAEELLKYARDDAQLCRELWVKHGHKWPEWERRLSQLTIEQGRRGVHIHQERLHAGITLLQRVILQATDKLPWVKTGRAPASPHGVAEACRASGIPCPPVKAHDADAAAEWEEQYAATQPWIKALKDLRKAKKTLATLETMQTRIREDGTMGFALKYFGAHTGRWSGDAGINFQNFNREPIFVRSDYTIEDDRKTIDSLLKVFEENPDDPKLQCIDVRGLLLPPPGMIIAAPDLSQIEPRVLCYIAGDTALLDSIRQGFPIYESHARKTMGWTGGDLKKEDKKKYSLAKARLLGLGFSCGWEKFITVAKTMAGLDITEDDERAALAQAHNGKIYDRDGEFHEGAWYLSDKPCAPYVLANNPRFQGFQEWNQYNCPWIKLPVYGANSRAIVADYRDQNPKVVALWRQFQEMLEASVGGDLVVELPSGRKLTYRAVRHEIRTVKDKETGLPRKKNVFTAEADGIRKVYYGGLLTENCITGDMEIRTAERGWIRLDSLQKHESVWDGIEFVSHGGLSYVGRHEVIECCGITCTPEHRFLSRGHWTPAEQIAKTGCVDVYSLVNGQTYSTSSVVLERPDRSTPRASLNSPPRRFQREAHSVDGAMRLREHGAAHDEGVSCGSVLFQAMPPVQSCAVQGHHEARDVASSGFRGLALDETAVHGPEPSGLQKLRRSWHNRVSRVAGIFSGLLGRDGADMEVRTGFGSNRQRARVQPGQLSLDHANGELPEHENRSSSGMGLGCGHQERDRSDDALLSGAERCAVPSGVFDAPRRVAQVYDVVNCGPRHRFAVRAPGATEYLIAHNCVQATARDVFAENMLRILDAGIWPMWSVHDEAVCAVYTEEEAATACRLMASCPDWLPGCPIASEATLSDRYKK